MLRSSVRVPEHLEQGCRLSMERRRAVVCPGGMLQGHGRSVGGGTRGVGGRGDGLVFRLVG